MARWIVAGVTRVDLEPAAYDVWHEDAPYRETRSQIVKWAGEGALAVKMQTASLFAFGVARKASVAFVAMVSNAIDHQGEQFDTGSMQDGLRILEGIARAARSYLEIP